METFFFLGNILQGLKEQMVHLGRMVRPVMTAFLACLVSTEPTDHLGRMGHLDQMVFLAFQAFQDRLVRLELVEARLLHPLPAAAEVVVEVEAVRYSSNSFQILKDLKTDSSKFSLCHPLIKFNSFLLNKIIFFLIQSNKQHDQQTLIFF
jgi:hypothetical protein